MGLYGNGFGETTQPAIHGSPIQTGTLSTLPVVQIGGITANVQFAGLIAMGLFQINVVVPAMVPNGNLSIRAKYKGFTTQAGALIAVDRWWAVVVLAGCAGGCRGVERAFLTDVTALGSEYLRG